MNTPRHNVVYNCTKVATVFTYCNEYMRAKQFLYVLFCHCVPINKLFWTIRMFSFPSFVSNITNNFHFSFLCFSEGSVNVTSRPSEFILSYTYMEFLCKNLERWQQFVYIFESIFLVIKPHSKNIPYLIKPYIFNL